MVTFRSRGEIVNQTETVQLRASFYNLNGELADLDLFPTITIIEPNGNIVLGPTSAGIAKISTGVYNFDFSVGINGSLGVWVDFWRGSIGSTVFTKELNFAVYNSQMPMINGDGYEALGDQIGFHYSQTEIRNINKIMQVVRARLNSSGFSFGYDSNGNPMYKACDIFSVEELVNFICQSLSLFNETPHFTGFTFSDSEIIGIYLDVLAQGAVIIALASKALIERGREIVVSDNGLNATMPSMGDLLNTQYTTELNNHFEKLKLIKQNMKPSPMSCGVLTLGTGARLPILRADSLRRAGRIY